MHQALVLVVEVHTVAVAVAPCFTLCASAFSRPTAVAVTLKAGVPYLPKVVLVDISLVKVGSNTRAARDGAVYAYAGNAYACHATEEVVAYLRFIST